ncbi:MOSC domain-containing protein, partial [Salmonella enterica subsp. enterica serovar Weltevreden]|nr:MOSC domain-containing protein [Salmonella enterica subsp. enterica serovar Weltevreden]
PYGGPSKPGKQSAIDKHPVGAPVAVGTLGLQGDEQGDRRIHGGPEKAVHCYPWQHYATWRQDIGPLPVLERAGAFGENLSWAGGDEQD